jgi:hypothetical protein
MKKRFTKLLTVIALSLLPFSLVEIQAQGETCVTALAVAAGPHTADGAASGSGASNTCYSSATHADWYSYTAPADGFVDISACLGGVDTRLSVYDACGGTCIASDDDTCPFAPDGSGSSYASEVTGIEMCSGNTIYIEWDDRWSTSGFNWNLTFTPGSPAGCGTPTVTCGATTNETYCYTTNDATTWGYVSSDGTSPLTLSFNFGGIESCCDNITIYDGSDNTGTVLFSGANGGDLTGVTATSTGSNIFMEVDSDSSIDCASGSGCCTTSWDWDVDCTVPENDLCANAMLISSGSSTGGTTVYATTTGEPPTCVTTVTAGGVWYVYNSITAETVTVDICGAPYDSKIGVYSGSCGGFTCVIGEDDDFSICGTDDPSVEFVTTASFAAEDYYIYVNGFGGGQGTFVITIAGVPLPVELISFEGQTIEKENKLTWVTASEENTEWHIIERSIDGQKDWTEIGRTRAAGTTAELQRYEMMDRAPLAQAYYRVKSVDYDLRFEYSNLVELQREDAPGDITVYPNPVSQELNVDFTLAKAQEVSIDISDVTGKLISVENFEASRGLNNHNINFSNLNSGVYFVTMTSSNGTVTKRVVKN